MQGSAGGLAAHDLNSWLSDFTSFTILFASSIKHAVLCACCSWSPAPAGAKATYLRFMSGQN